MAANESGGGQVQQQQVPNYSQEQTRQIERQYQQEVQRRREAIQNGEYGRHGKRMLRMVEGIGKLSGNDRVAAMDAMLQMSEVRERMRTVAEQNGYSNPWQGVRDGNPQLTALRQELRGHYAVMREVGLINERNWRDAGGLGRRDRGGLDRDPITSGALRDLFPRNSDIANVHAQGLYNAGDFEGAAMAATEALSLDPQNDSAYSTLANAKMQFGDWEGAAEASRAALEINPKNQAAAAAYRLSRGRANAGSSAPDAGAADAGAGYRAGAMAGNFRDFAAPVSDLNPRAGGQSEREKALGALRMVGRAKTLLAQRDYRAAREAAEKAIALNPGSADAHYARALALMRTKNFKEALKSFDEALQFSGKDARKKSMIWTAKSKVLNLLRQHDDALGAADTAIKFDGRNAEAYLQKAWALDGQGAERRLVKAAVCDAARYNSRRYRKYCEQFDVFGDGELAAFLAGEGTPGGFGEEPKNKGSDWAGLLSSRRGLVMAFSGLFAALMIGIGLLRGFGKEGKAALRDAMRGLTRTSPTLQADHQVLGAELTPGTVIGGAYTVEKQIGTGGMGVVFSGTDSNLHRKVAIKKMREEIRSDPRERERFLKEARTVAKMHHTNIVDIYAIVEDNQDAYLIFEYVAGKTIHQLIHEKRRFTFSEALGVMRGAASALDYAHKRGIIHRDLKPSNIMIDAERQVKVMDFGVARLAKDSMTRMSMTNTIVGTPPYMAPEQEQGMVKSQSDVYALGVLLYEMVTGQMPFQGVGAGMLMSKINKTYVPPSRVASDLPDGIDALIDKALDPEPDKRFQTCAELVRAMQALLAAAPGSHPKSL